MAIEFEAEMEQNEEFSAEFAGNYQQITIPGKDGGYYMPVVTQTDENTMTVTYEPSQEGMEPIAPMVIALLQGPKGDTGDRVAARPER